MGARILGVFEGWSPKFAWRAWALMALSALAPLVIQNKFYLYLIQVICVYTLACTGLNLLSGYAGLMSFGHGGVFAVGAYAFVIPLVTFKWPFVAALASAVLCSAVTGILLGIPSLRMGSYYLALVTLAFGILMEQWLIEWVDLTGGWNGISGIPHPTLGLRAGPVDGFYYVILVAAALGYFLARNLVTSRWGRQLVCIREGEVIAGTVGTDAYRTKLTIFLISAVYAGIGGALYAGLIGFISPDSFRVDLSVFFFLSMVIGGMGSLSGPLIGVSVLFLIPQVFLLQFQSYRLLLYGALTIVIAVLLPEGITGAIRRRFARPVVSDFVHQIASEQMPAIRPVPGAQEGLGGVLLRLEEVSKRFGGVRALEAVSVEVPSHQCCAIIGPNGSGKTTLLNLINGLYRLDGGGVWFRGHRLDRLPAHRIAKLGVARTFQTPRLFGELSVLETIMLGSDMHSKASALECMLRLPRARQEETQAWVRAAALATFIGLGKRATSVAKTLSHGHQRLVELGRALASDPALILLDEPAAGLTSEEIRHFGQLLAEVIRTGTSVVLIEHRMDLVVRAAHVVFVLDGGRRIAGGRPEEVVRDPVVVEAYLGATSARKLPILEGSGARTD